MSGIDMEYNGQPNGHNSENGGDRYDEPLRNIEPREDYDKFEEDYPESSDPCEGFGKRAGNYDPVTGTYPRISRPVEVIRPSYDCVVIGSGYGGAVAASRMARGHKSVCLLERGKERWPGEFPTDSVPAIRELHMTNAATDGVIGRLGKAALGHDPTGLYHLYVGDGQNAFVANGLGGTSLLNANVFLEADSKTLDLPIWPKDIKGQGLKNYYERARSVLEPEQYPQDYPRLQKLDTLEKQAKLMGWGDKFYRVPQTTRFRDGDNSTGVSMKASTLTGQDTTGLNDGSKSTTLVNYLSDAWNWGAEMFCQCEVRYVTKAVDREGYIVHFAWHGGKRANFKDIFHEDLMWVHAKELVFFGAGSIGTTEILLRSKKMGLEMSKDVGHGMSGNGDILAFGYNTNEYVNSIGRPDPPPNRPVGPCITGVIDCRDQENPLDGFVIEEGAVPAALAPFYELMLSYMPGRIFPSNLKLSDKIGHVGAAVSSRVLGPYSRLSATEKTQCYLIMSHDSSQATMSLVNDRPFINYSGVGKSQRVKKLSGYLSKMTNLIGGTYVDSPFYAAFGEKEITVHAIGGARISNNDTGENGGVNANGQLFTGQTEKVHKGLVVCDGTIVPAALGVNPFATITALAERSVEKVAEEFGIDIDYKRKNGPLNLFGKPAHTPNHDANVDVERVQTIIQAARVDQTSGVAFSEMMDGWIHIGEDAKDLSFERAFTAARGKGEYSRFFLTARSWNTHNLVNDKEHQATLTGTFTCPQLGGTCMVQGGKFQLFNDDPRAPDTTNLTYNFTVACPNGRNLHFNGYKVVNSNVVLNPLNLWKATTTLYCTISELEEKDAQGQALPQKVVGKGIIHIRPSAFLSEVTTMVPTGTTLYDRVTSTANFLGFFAAKAAGAFLTPFIPMQWPSLPFNNYENLTAPNATITVTARDNVKSKLVMWNPGKGQGQGFTSDDAPIIFMIPGAAVDHQIFSLPTIKNNAVNYYRERGFRVYSMTHRVGKTVVAQQNWTPYDARRDIHAALEEIRRRHNIETKPDGSGPNKTLYVIGHCAGSVALSCGLLDGTIPRQWLSGVTASQVFMNPTFAKVNNLKASMPISPAWLYSLFQGNWFDCSSSPQDGYVQQALNQLLRFYPVGRRDEICNSVVCHRSSLVFGRLWSHKNLNEATHSQLENFLGGTSMASLQYLMNTGTTSHVVDTQGANLVTPQNLARLRGLPIFFFSGSENSVYLPENTDTSFTALSDANGGLYYERQVFEGRGHLDAWMSSTAHQDVFPRVLNHINNVHEGKYASFSKELSKLKSAR
ncbi:glucose-methanol-choline oxidoreductase [Colletotrichum plurivorum]|uniref:Glucose-methanol-choline oxidoreductase n=1 Tax=Colletotrichum plurivorum TaxID=2175906 RepID=A0A8H6K4U0_9PEZI|nr:glucose-methanol-choline oxidoreductase [Colletotrichum plurivorum]